MHLLCGLVNNGEHESLKYVSSIFCSMALYLIFTYVICCFKKIIEVGFIYRSSFSTLYKHCDTNWLETMEPLSARKNLDL